MNQRFEAQSAYRQIADPIRTARGTEYAVIARITHRIKNAHLKGDSGYPELVAALDENRKLWTNFAVDVAGADNALPSDLRAKIFFLAEFTLAQTGKILAGSGNAKSLIDINLAVMRGLRGQGAAS